MFVDSHCHLDFPDLASREDEILAANAEDLAYAAEKGLSPAMVDRLTLTPAAGGKVVSVQNVLDLLAENNVAEGIDLPFSSIISPFDFQGSLFGTGPGHFIPRPA